MPCPSSPLALCVVVCALLCRDTGRYHCPSQAAAPVRHPRGYVSKDVEELHGVQSCHVGQQGRRCCWQIWQYVGGSVNRCRSCSFPCTEFSCMCTSWSFLHAGLQAFYYERIVGTTCPSWWVSCHALVRAGCLRDGSRTRNPSLSVVAAAVGHTVHHRCAFATPAATRVRLPSVDSALHCCYIVDCVLSVSVSDNAVVPGCPHRLHEV